MALSKEEIIKKGLKGFETDRGKFILNQIIPKETTQEEIKYQLREDFAKRHIPEKDKKGERVNIDSLNSLVSNYLNAWVELNYLNVERKTNPKAKDKFHPNDNFYSLNSAKILFDYLKEEYNIRLGEIKKCINESDKEITEEIKNLHPNILFNIFFNNPRVKECISKNYPNYLTFPEFLWNILKSINFAGSTDEKIDEDFKKFLILNKKSALQIIKFKRIGELLLRETSLWYDNPSQIPKEFIVTWFKNADSIKKEYKTRELELFSRELTPKDIEIEYKINKKRLEPWINMEKENKQIKERSIKVKMKMAQKFGNLTIHETKLLKKDFNILKKRFDKIQKKLNDFVHSKEGKNLIAKRDYLLDIRKREKITAQSEIKWQKEYANNLFMEIYPPIIYSICNTKKAQFLGISENTKDIDEKELLKILKIE